MFPLLLVLLAVPLFLSARKQKRAMAEQQKLQNDLAPGDKVMTTSGLYGTVADASHDTTIDIEISEGVVTRWLRAAIREKVVDVEETAVEKADDHELEAEPATTTTTTVAEPATAQVAEPLDHNAKK
ncbi:preprotein translocase subunit YajC [Nocardia sp. NRRL S-836]|uniref:preprotein translocase subunit YajC n=1 Tax=Nocardia sp. NRRL S-836 TaxID=1519492 RepID=UPI0006AE2EAA|nr:preprotein translocase subunit YajC [Nocardia sp. NRRL S-836]KOV81438.1 preprotein translocase subunit YajC [Nocardia sp. NRRL S-836]